MDLLVGGENDNGINGNGLVNVKRDWVVNRAVDVFRALRSIIRNIFETAMDQRAFYRSL